MTESTGVRTLHSFSFGPHYDPGNVGFGPLTCHDDHTLEPGCGFPDHAHGDVEIVTWVVDGGLVHDGSPVMPPGAVAVQSAGSGIRHSEVAGDAGCRFVQAWLRPDDPGGTPARHLAEAAIPSGELVTLVGPGGWLPVGVAGASLSVARLPAGGRVTVPAAPLVHGYVVAGAVSSPYGRLDEGDALRSADEPELPLAAEVDAEVLVWRFDAS